jgi:hypothetical protein
MGPMKRVALLPAFVLAVLAAGAAPAQAAARPCANAVVQEWLQIGHVDDDHPLGCYREALSRLDDYTDLAVYSDLSDSIDAALAAAVARTNGKPVPQRYRDELKKPRPPAGGPVATAAAPVAATEGTSVPVPLLVLGALALALTAVGAGGVVARRRRSGS